MEGGNIRSIPIVGKFLIDPSVLERLEGVQEKHGLPVDRAAEYLMLTRAVLDGELPLEHMPELIAEAFGVDADKAKRIACDVAGVRLLPLEKYFPGTAKQIEAWGGKASDYPSVEVGKEKITADRFAGQLTEDLGLSLQPNHIKRLGFLIKGYYSGEKTREATLTFFSRGATIGGLGLGSEVAGPLMEEVDHRKEFVEFVDDPKLETFAEEETPSDSPINGGEETPVVEDTPPFMEGQGVVETHLATTTPVKPEIIIGGVTAPRHDADEKEIALHAKKAAKVGGEAPGVDAKLNEAVNVAVESAADILHARRVSKKKFADIAKLAIRGVREPLQTRGVLERDLGFAGDELDALVEAIDTGAAAYHGTTPPAPMNGGAIGGVTAPRPSAPSETDVLDKRFAEVTKTLPKAPVEPVLPSARVSAARTKEDEVAAQAAKVDPGKLAAAAEASRPEPAKAQLTVGSVPPPAPGEQKVVTDVQFRPRLVGPVDELGTMGPADFRRLSSDPAEAVRKIEELLAALQATSYEDRIRGVQAWRSSPISGLYVAMAEEALRDGVALADIASRRRNKGEESLSPAEMKAIGSLNARIRF